MVPVTILHRLSQETALSIPSQLQGHAALQWARSPTQAVSCAVHQQKFRRPSSTPNGRQKELCCLQEGAHAGVVYGERLHGYLPRGELSTLSSTSGRSYVQRA